MKSLLKITTCAVALAAVAGLAAPKYPFPQNMKSPHGTTALYADPSVIKEHFEKWKGAWYKDMGNEAWILAPEGDCSTVSEGIAYGMMIMVYMSDNSKDYKNEFDKLYSTWKNHGGANGGMDWRINNGNCSQSAGSGSASDADFDAALALIMASKQWGDDSYLNAAKTLISWIGQNDIDGNNSVKGGSGWSDAFNPSYGTLANFELFGKVTGDSKWNSVKSKAEQDLLACQNSTTGLVPDWCSWDSHQPTRTNANVAQADDPGFFDDAARTPWRMAWAYYWYGNNNAKKFNDKIVKWMYKESKMNAAGINSGYYVDGRPSSARDVFVSSTFSGGMGLAAASADEAEPYLETVYKTLKSMTSCAKASGCGEAGTPGEKYYPATLNILYLLLMTGNMPNLYDMSGFEKFTPDPNLGQQLTSSDGAQVEKGDSAVGLSGFWNWGAYHDKLGIGTVMKPDSGSNPLYVIDGVVYANASMEIGPEPEYDEEKKKAGLLKYPSAGIAMSFRGDEKGVDFTTLGVASVRITVKTSGTIRFAMLYEEAHCAGCEPGILLDPTDDYKTLTFKLKPNGFTLGDLEVDEWMTNEEVPAASANDVMKTASGVKFEAKMPKGGTGSVSVKSIEFLDGSDNVIDPEKLVGFKVPNDLSKYSTTTPGSSSSTVVGSSNSVGQSSSSVIGLAMADALSTIKVATSGLSVQILNAKLGANYAIMSVQGKVIASGKITSASHAVTLPNKGMYLVKVGSEIRPVSVK